MALLPGAIGLTLAMFAEAIGPARTFAGKYRYRIDANQELIGMGFANLGAGWFQGFAIGASLSKSAANDERRAQPDVRRYRGGSPCWWRSSSRRSLTTCRKLR